ncbi:MAG: uracil-DNA glycosylase [Thaumarchaeota archaeon]|nr:uracil-DNA glycosylase [Nitrososphaerota archaeon]|tara:strand:- start:2053 stop:2709 length:657 start_codon:yes stop_codon:yes gene_type:complete
MYTLDNLTARIITCKKCPRLAKYIRTIAKEKVRRYNDWKYWGRPLPGFGDPYANLLVIGLAPAAHGGNRTGRMFTGDSSGDWLMRALHESGFANQYTSEKKDDGLILKNVYITAIVRCAPPKNKPVTYEIENCSRYLAEELKLLKNVKVVLTLGTLAFNTYASLRKIKGLKFIHAASYDLTDIILIASYHPSRQNTQTGRLKWNEWIDVFRKINDVIN